MTVALGVQLVGEGGGEWVLDLRDGALRVRAGSREQAAFSYVQTRRGLARRALGGARRRGRSRRRGAVPTRARPRSRPRSGSSAREIPAALEALGALRGLLHVVVSDAGGDWRVGLQLGPGEIPREADHRGVRVRRPTPTQMASGELKPIEAFMAGRIRVARRHGRSCSRCRPRRCRPRRARSAARTRG